MFNCGKRQQDYSNECPLPASGRLLPEFDVDKRRSIKDMFARKPASIPSGSVEPAARLANMPATQVTESTATHTTFGSTDSAPNGSTRTAERNQTPQILSRKRTQPLPATFAKRSKSAVLMSPRASTAGQKTLTGFFKPKSVDAHEAIRSPMASPGPPTPSLNRTPSKTPQGQEKALKINPQPPGSQEDIIRKEADASTEWPTASKFVDGTIIDPIVSKEDWSKLFTKKPVPPCDGHQEPCISLTTKKPGMNRGRSFWICPRPLGPSGEKEKGTQWRCHTFIWASDWNSPVATQEE